MVLQQLGAGKGEIPPRSLWREVVLGFSGAAGGKGMCGAWHRPARLCGISQNHINKCMAMAATVFALIDAIENGSEGVKSAFYRVQLMMVVEKWVQEYNPEMGKFGSRVLLEKDNL